MQSKKEPREIDIGKILRELGLDPRYTEKVLQD